MIYLIIYIYYNNDNELFTTDITSEKFDKLFNNNIIYMKEDEKIMVLHLYVMKKKQIKLLK